MRRGLLFQAQAPAGAESYARGLREMGARRVAVFLQDRGDFLAALVGAWLADCTVVLPGDCLPATVRALKDVLGVDTFLGDFPGEVKVARQALARPGLGLSVAKALNPQGRQLVVWTSGSSGSPVPLYKRLEQLSNEVDALEAAFGGVVDGSTFFTSVSHQHLYGLLFTVLWPWAAGRLVAAGSVVYPEALEGALSTGPCALVSSPALLKRLPDALKGRLATHHLKALFSSGGPLTAQGDERCRDILGRACIEVYGSSETGGIAFRESGPQARWQLFPDVVIRVDEAGQLCVRSPLLEDDGWYTTADRARLEAETFELLGRADRIVKLEEKRVSLDELEQRFMATGLLSEVGVVVGGGEDRGEQERGEGGGRTWLGVVGVPSVQGESIHSSGGRRALSERLRDGLRDAVDRLAWPRRFRFVSQLPMTSQGKTTSADLLSLFAPERPTAHWLEKSQDRAAAELQITPDLRVLQGHFPSIAVVPGVAQIAWAIALGREAFALPPNVLRMEAVKFQSLLVPGHTVTLTLEYSVSKQTLAFRYAALAKVYSSGRLVFSSKADTY